MPALTIDDFNMGPRSRAFSLGLKTIFGQVLGGRGAS